MNDMQPGHFPDRLAVQATTEESLWIADWRKTGSRQALTRIVQAHAGRIRAMARVWARDTPLQDDLVSEGVIALIGSLRGYVPQDGLGLFAYARPFVRAAMRRTFYQSRSIIDLPLYELRRLREGRASPEEQARYLGATRPEPLEAPESDLGTDNGTGEALLIRAEADADRTQALEAALSGLTRIDRLFVERRRSEDPCSLDVLALRLGISPVQAARIEARALARLRTRLILQGVTSSGMGGL